jgi:hypothetical protein
MQSSGGIPKWPPKKCPTRARFPIRTRYDRKKGRTGKEQCSRHVCKENRSGSCFGVSYPRGDSKTDVIDKVQVGRRDFPRLAAPDEESILTHVTTRPVFARKPGFLAEEPHGSWDDLCGSYPVTDRHIIYRVEQGRTSFTSLDEVRLYLIDFCLLVC